MSNPQIPRMSDEFVIHEREAEIRAAMEQSERDVAAGLTVPLSEVLLELDTVIERIEARRRTRNA